MSGRGGCWNWVVEVFSCCGWGHPADEGGPGDGDPPPVHFDARQQAIMGMTLEQAVAFRGAELAACRIPLPPAPLPVFDHPAEPEAAAERPAWLQQVFTAGRNAAIAQASAAMTAGGDFNAVMASIMGYRAAIAVVQNDPDRGNFGRPRLSWDTEPLAAVGDDGDLEAAKAVIAQRIERSGTAAAAAVEANEKTPMGGPAYTAPADQARNDFNGWRAAGQLAQDGPFREISLPVRQIGNLGAADVPFTALLRRKARDRVVETGGDPENADTLRDARDHVLTHLELPGYQCVGTIDGEPVPLTSCAFTDEAANADGSTIVGVWSHTPPEQLPRIMQHLQTLHEALLAAAPAPEGGGALAPPQTAPEALQRALARSIWWFCHAMPYHRGSAAAAEVYADSALRSRGYLPLGELGRGLDLVAFRTPEAAFATHVVALLTPPVVPAPV